MDFGVLVLRAADANRDGELTRAEWQAFTAGTVQAEQVDGDLLKARALIASKLNTEASPMRKVYISTARDYE